MTFQPCPTPPAFLRRYHLPRKSKRARNGDGLGPRLTVYHVNISTLHHMQDRKDPPNRHKINNLQRSRLGRLLQFSQVGLLLLSNAVPALFQRHLSTVPPLRKEIRVTCRGPNEFFTNLFFFTSSRGGFFTKDGFSLIFACASLYICSS